MKAESLKAEILRLARAHARQTHANRRPGGPRKFAPGVTPVPYAGRTFGNEEVAAAVGSVLDFWLTLGPEGDAFARELATVLGVRTSVLVNSGSSANLLAVAALTSPKLPPERRLRPRDEVITCAAGFPTTVAPIVQHGAVPVFLDNHPLTGNVDCARLEEAFVPGKTKAVMLAHALGNPFDLATVMAFCRKRGLWLIEDNCDALGSLYTVKGELPRSTGSFGDLSTQSFYPPHHITMGEGGAVSAVREMRFKSILESLRDWGRDCWCASGHENTCGKRFGWQLGELPAGYDHKYIYSHLGYNLKPLDLQAAIGRQQLTRLDEFGRARRANWKHLRRGLDDLGEFFEFMLPTHARAWTKAGFRWDDSGCRSDPSWFGFMLLVRKGTPFSRLDLARFLEERKIGTRMLFGGNLVRQPAWVRLRRDHPHAFRIAGKLAGADQLMENAMFVGVYPGLSRAMLDYIVESVHEFVRGKTRF